MAVVNAVLRFSRLLLVSRRHRRVRRGVVFVFTNVLLAACILFFVETILILLGVGDIFLPLKNTVSSFLTHLLF